MLCCSRDRTLYNAMTSRIARTTHNTIPLSQVHPPSGLQLPLTLKWRRCRDMPCAMEVLQSVTVRKKGFVGGGVTDSLYGDAHTIYEYDEASNQWISLPQYNCRRFAMAILTNKLTLVGGIKISTGPTNQVAVWEGEGMSRGWTHPYPPMTTPCYSPAVATYGDRLVVAGEGQLSNYLATVEVLNTTSHQWFSASPLPMGCNCMTSAIVNQELFLLGGDTDHGGTRCVPPRHNAEQCSLRHHQQICAMAYHPRTSTDKLCHHISPWISTSSWGTPLQQEQCSHPHLPACYEQLEEGWRLTFSTIILFMYTISEWSYPGYGRTWQ